MDGSNFRRDRIEKLFHELKYEIERGMMEGDIDETLGFRWYVPISKSIKDGVVFCEFRSRPVLRHYMDPRDLQPRLRLVKNST